MPGPSKPIIRHPKPDLTRFTSRRIDVPANRTSLELILREWIQQVVDYIGQNAPIDGLRPANYLTATADGIETLMYAPTGMSLDVKTPNVFAEFVWGRRPDGHWYIRHVKFAPNVSQAALKEAERVRMKDRLLEIAETKNAQHFHARQAVFPAEQYIHTWEDEIRRGDAHLKFLIEDIYKHAKEEASMPENWVTGWDLALAFAGDAAMLKWAKGAKATAKTGKMYETAGEDAIQAGKRIITSGNPRVELTYAAGAASPQAAARGLGIMSEGEAIAQTGREITEVAEHAEKIAHIVHGAHGTHFAYEAGKEISEQFGDEESEVFRKRWYDSAADIAVDAAGFIPGAGGLVKMFAGMFIEMGLANYAGIVAKIRGRVYSCFVGGFITGITLAPNSPLEHERDRKYYELGLQKAFHLGSRASFQYQIALLHYAMEHYTSGFWAGTTPQLHGLKASHWDYPDDWEAKWSPLLLGQSLVTMLGFKHYMIE